MKLNPIIYISGLDFEGIYRISGASSNIKKLKSLFINGG